MSLDKLITHNTGNMFKDTEIVVYKGIIAEWSLIKLFVTVRQLARKANAEEIERYNNRLDETPKQ